MTGSGHRASRQTTVAVCWVPAYYPLVGVFYSAGGPMLRTSYSCLADRKLLQVGGRCKDYFKTLN